MIDRSRRNNGHCPSSAATLSDSGNFGARLINFGFVLAELFAAAIAFFVAQAVFNRTLIAWLNSNAQLHDPAFMRSHQGVLLGWLLLSFVCLLVDLIGSLWFALQAFRLIWDRRPK
jgi:hypothetical protein